MLRLHPLDFSQIIDEDCEWNNNGQQASTTTTTTTPLQRENHHRQVVVGGGGARVGLDVVEEVDETEVIFGTPFYDDDEKKKPDGTTTNAAMPPSILNRVPSTRTNDYTLNTTVTEDTHEFEDMCQRHEALYWRDQEVVACSEQRSSSLRAVPPQPHQQQQQPTDRDHHRDRSSSSGNSGRMSIEERARRLRELSRSRSRSDGSGSVSFDSGHSIC